MLFPICIKHNLYWHMAKGSRKSAEVTEGMGEGLAKDSVGLTRVERENGTIAKCTNYGLCVLSDLI